jgi:hypothetical protein
MAVGGNAHLEAIGAVLSRVSHGVKFRCLLCIFVPIIAEPNMIEAKLLEATILYAVLSSAMSVLLGAKLPLPRLQLRCFG